MGEGSHAGEAFVVLRRRVSEVVTDAEEVICGNTNTSPRSFGPHLCTHGPISVLALGCLSASTLAVCEDGIIGTG